ncbi:hypothetical protein TIFTF001_024885 [Ficus carica]|uniref:Protein DETOXIFICATION n=1 Tax=Ficus carica TaxID=3494 RepID=A0AA88DDQ9_FICCA|nr:hypothetical protein TIFTF001_024885 [Ficus carica]
MAVQLQIPLLQNPKLNFLNNRTPSPTFFNLKNPNFSFSPRFSSTLCLPSLRFSSGRRRFVVPGCVSAGRESLVDDRRISGGGEDEDDGVNDSAPPATVFDEGGEEEEGIVAEVKREELESQGMWSQMKEIAMFTGPLSGLWICGPLMSLIDTVVIGQGSSIELAALGPGTVLCDNLSYDKKEVQHHISVLLFIGLACGFSMLLFTRFFGSWALTAFTGAKNSHVVPAANTYVQVVAGYMMIEALNKKGYNGYAISIPSPKELLAIVGLAAPVFVTMMAKVAFYTILVYFVTSMGTNTMAAHQVMIQTLFMCTVWGEPLSQTAQSFMPELLYGVKRSLEKARMLLKSLVTIGIVVGLVLGVVGTSIPWLFPKIFTHDQMVIREMHKILVPYFLALSVTPPTHSLEGTLLAGRDLKFISMSMSGCFTFGAILLMIVSSKGFGLVGCWSALAAFQWTRLFLALRRLLSPEGILYSEDQSKCTLENLKACFAESSRIPHMPYWPKTRSLPS